MDILHQHNAQLIQQNHEPFFDVCGKDFALTGAEQFQQWTQEGFVDQHLMARMADQQFVELELFQADCVRVSKQIVKRDFIKMYTYYVNN